MAEPSGCAVAELSPDWRILLTIYNGFRPVLPMSILEDVQNPSTANCEPFYGSIPDE
jgi:hypothetical protein